MNSSGPTSEPRSRAGGATQTSQADEAASWLARIPTWWLAAFFFAIYSAISLFRHLQIQSTGYDLGIFEQAVRSYAELRAPVADLKGPGFNLLGDHFHPILILLAPVYRIFPNPATLLIAQAALLALSVVPIMRLATDWLGRRNGVYLGAAYGLSWGVQQAVWFDFHEVAFAVPLVAWSVASLGFPARSCGLPRVTVGVV